ncbi:MAG: hypothetical protein H0X73_14000 [Chthoniobacterales bacterium]|nr:hypothetical protein [Chthoniobacterales bacterium]
MAQIPKLTLNNAERCYATGKATKDRGKYLEVFEKQADGKWKCGADAFNTDFPATPSSETK